MIKVFAVTVVVLPYVAQLVGFILLGRASLALSSKIGSQYSRGGYLKLSALAVLPGSGWRRGVDIESAKHIDVFRRRAWVAVGLIGGPVYFALLVQLL